MPYWPEHQSLQGQPSDDIQEKFGAWAGDSYELVVKPIRCQVCGQDATDYDVLQSVDRDTMDICACLEAHL